MDEEQNTKEQEIFDILVAAGYFRARIKGLSAFDKIVGGMTWCIVSCDYDVDVDLLFHENLTIGQKMYSLSCSTHFPTCCQLIGFIPKY